MAGFAWRNKFVAPHDDPRSDGGFTGERETLIGYLRDQRLTLELKCADLTPAQLAERSVPPSNLSLLGLVRHMADVECTWFRIRLAGQASKRIFAGDDPTRDAAFENIAPTPEAVTEAFEAWRNEVAFADEYIAASQDLSDKDHSQLALREILTHMIEEYARHNGHADFLRERIDGRIGQ